MTPPWRKSNHVVRRRKNRRKAGATSRCADAVTARANTITFLELLHEPNRMKMLSIRDAELFFSGAMVEFHRVWMEALTAVSARAGLRRLHEGLSSGPDLLLCLIPSAARLVPVLDTPKVLGKFLAGFPLFGGPPWDF